MNYLEYNIVEGRLEVNYDLEKLEQRTYSERTKKLMMSW